MAKYSWTPLDCFDCGFFGGQNNIPSFKGTRSPDDFDDLKGLKIVQNVLF